MRRSNSPETLRGLQKVQISFLVLFVGDTPESERVVARVRPIARELRGVTPIVLINCSEPRSAEFCAENTPKVPALVMFNQDFRFQTPQVYDGELDWDESSDTAGK